MLCRLPVGVSGEEKGEEELAVRGLEEVKHYRKCLGEMSKVAVVFR